MQGKRGIRISYMLVPALKKVWTSTPAMYEAIAIRIDEKVTQYFDISIIRIKNNRRHRETTLARQIAMLLIRRHTKLGLKDIGKRYGGRDHTTVLHSLTAIQNEMDTNEMVRKQIIEIETKVLA